MWKPNRTKSTASSASPTNPTHSLKSVFSKFSHSRPGPSVPPLPAPLPAPAGRKGGRGGQLEQVKSSHRGKERTACVHFMLGNTHPYTPTQWTSTLLQIHSSGINTIVLNLGKEDWQLSQAESCLRIMEGMFLHDHDQDEHEDEQGEAGARGLKVFLSLDMNVLPSTTQEDMLRLIEFTAGLMRSKRYFRQKDGRHVLSTFGGHGCGFGGNGWEGFLKTLGGKGFDVFFIPSFFLPPDKILGIDVVDGVFNWNAAWPMGDHPISMVEDLPFIQHRKPYMAAVSPWFFTHYGITGEWAWNKNWVYRSDDHLYVSRWLDIIRPEFDPEFVQIISWNDFGESHYIGPVVPAEPGSQEWTRGMPHEGWRKMTEWFIRRYKRVPLEMETETRVYLSYRLQSKDCMAEEDKAQDVVSIVVTVPPHVQLGSRMILTIDAGHMNTHDILIEAKDGLAMALVPFIPGPVGFQLRSNGEVVLHGRGPPIANEVSTGIYNFNAWTGTWGTKY